MAETVKDKIAGLGLRNVGLPLALALACEGVEVVGSDTNGDVSTDTLKSTATKFTSGAQDLAGLYRASSIKIAGASNTKVAGAFDPWVSPDLVPSKYGTPPVQTLETGAYDGIILAVSHSEIIEMGADKIRALGRPNATVYDLKGVLGRAGADLRP